ncbi:DMT family transporter [Streptomyces sp. NPDC007094]|uniref:DMT family transporter n=1 Tax=Streptomyces sp. NPDC007094 TaxID=3155359 RepID=UPI0033DA1CCF
MSAAAVPAAGSVSPRPAWVTDLPVLAVAAVWGASYLAAKGVTTSHTVVAVLVLRFAIVLPVLVTAGWRKLRALTAAQWRGAGVLGLVLSGIFLLETYGVVHTSATNAGLIISLTMIFTPLAEAAVTRVRPTAGFMAAAGLSGTGASPWSTAAGFGPREWAGLVFLSVFCTLFAFFVQMWSVRRTSPSRVGLLLGTEPLWAAAVGISLGGEQLGALGAAGAVLVLAGTAWGRRAALGSVRRIRS